MCLGGSPPRCLISLLYARLSCLEESVALSYMMAWEHDLGPTIDGDDWEIIWKATRKVSICTTRAGANVRRHRRPPYCAGLVPNWGVPESCSPVTAGRGFGSSAAHCVNYLPPPSCGWSSCLPASLPGWADDREGAPERCSRAWAMCCLLLLLTADRARRYDQPCSATKITTRTGDINELNLPKTCEIEFSDHDDLLNFKLVICPDEGFYKGGKFVFSFKVGQGYPHDPPKVKCETMVYHPNIDLEGNVCLNILREDWKPVLTINSIIYGLQYLFLEPNPEDPLNKEAAEVLQNNRRLFEQNVQRSMRDDTQRGRRKW
uniref:NEDD8-conjugating enzyme UBC12 n=1 Tax=Leptobrachium leishanense TaxID=445787 RepID=A0A8C5PI60_9ANUR